MARPSTAAVLAHTENGVPFQWLLDDYQEKGARDANLEVIQALVAWGDAEDFLREVVGYTEWDGSQSGTLTRHRPLACPLRSGLWCESYDLVDMGTDADSFDDFEDDFEECFKQDWCIYSLHFTRPQYFVLSDAELAGGAYGNKEKYRYCTFGRQYRPRERRISGFAFEYDTSVAQDWSSSRVVPDESPVVPDYQLNFRVKWCQVPYRAVPDAAIARQLLTVNDAPFQIRQGGQTWAAGWVLFKGPDPEIVEYQGADGDYYADVSYLFSVQPGAGTSTSARTSTGWATGSTGTCAAEP
jgi:hypothetical protein